MRVNLEGKNLQGKRGNYLPSAVFTWVSVPCLQLPVWGE